MVADLFSDVGDRDENDDSEPFFELNDGEPICDTADVVEPFEWNEDKIDCVLGDEWPIAAVAKRIRFTGILVNVNDFLFLSLSLASFLLISHSCALVVDRVSPGARKRGGEQQMPNGFDSISTLLLIRI